MKGFEVEAKDIDDWDVLEADLAKHNCEDMESTFELSLELDPSEEKIIDHGNPYLREHCVF